MCSPIKLDFSFYDFSMIFQKFTENKKKKKIQIRRHCSKSAVTVAKPPLKTAPGGKSDGFR
jgi:hypothetical protein